MKVLHIFRLKKQFFSIVHYVFYSLLHFILFFYLIVYIFLYFFPHFFFHFPYSSTLVFCSSHVPIASFLMAYSLIACLFVAYLSFMAWLRRFCHLLVVYLFVAYLCHLFVICFSTHWTCCSLFVIHLSPTSLLVASFYVVLPLYLLI